MNRRDFLATSSATVALSALPFTFGCSSTTLADLVQTLGNSASQIAALEGNTSLASKLLTDTGAAVTAIDNWKSGSIATEVIEALNIVEDDLNLFPLTGPYIPLIDLAIGTVESILSLLPASTAAVTPRAQRRSVSLGYAAPKTASQYKKRYNAIVAVHPEWRVAPIQ